MTNIKILALILLVISTSSKATETITAVHAFPRSLVYTESFLSFVDKVNEEGKGIVEIKVKGGPEVIGLSQQPNAVRNGVVDMAYTAGSFYAGTIPERDALIASNTNAIYARKSGGIDLLNKIHQEKMGVYYLAWFDSGVKYNLYMINEPNLNTDGSLNMKNVRLRSNPVYDAFFQQYLGAKPISIPTTDVYSALERSIVSSTAWTQVGLKDLGWDKFLKYKLEPSFFSTDMGVIINKRKWDSLTEEAKKVIQKVAIQHEQSSALYFDELAKEQQKELEQSGIKTVYLSENAKNEFIQMARQTTWERMKDQMLKHPSGLENYDKLIELFNE